MQNLGNSNPQRNLDNPVDFRYGEAGGRLYLVDGDVIEYAICTSNVIEVNGVNVKLSAVGSSTIICDRTEELINNVGVTTGFAPSSDTGYYAYLYNGADATPVRVRLSQAVPVLVDGIKYLNTSGAGLNWRFVGVVALTGGTPFFRDDETARLIANQYNRIRKPLFTCPGYNDNNADTILTLVSGTAWAGLNAGTGDSVMLCTTGEDSIDLQGVVTVSLSAGATWYVGLGLEPTLALARAEQRTGTTCRNNQTNQPSSFAASELPEEAGLLWASLNAYTNSSAPTVYADMARRGATADTPATFLVGSVMV